MKYMIEGIDNAIKDILLVEEECAAIVAKASEKASELSFSTASMIEEVKKKAADNDKLSATEALKRAEEEGEKRAKALIEENETAASALIERARANMDKCVEEILRSIEGNGKL